MVVRKPARNLQSTRDVTEARTKACWCTVVYCVTRRDKQVGSHVQQQVALPAEWTILQSVRCRPTQTQRGRKVALLAQADIYVALPENISSCTARQGNRRDWPAVRKASQEGLTLVKPSATGPVGDRACKNTHRSSEQTKTEVRQAAPMTLGRAAADRNATAGGLDKDIHNAGGGSAYKQYRSATSE